MVGSLILLLAALFVGWRYWALGQEAAQVERDIDGGSAAKSSGSPRC